MSNIIPIVVAFITGGLSLLGTIITVIVTMRKGMSDIENKLITAQAVTDTKMDELTREVREHNNFARRMPVVEEKIEALEKRLDKVENND